MLDGFTSDGDYAELIVASTRPLASIAKQLETLYSVYSVFKLYNGDTKVYQKIKERAIGYLSEKDENSVHFFPQFVANGKQKSPITNSNPYLMCNTYLVDIFPVAGSHQLEIAYDTDCKDKTLESSIFTIDNYQWKLYVKLCKYDIELSIEKLATPTESQIVFGNVKLIFLCQYDPTYLVIDGTYLFGNTLHNIWKVEIPRDIIDSNWLKEEPSTLSLVRNLIRRNNFTIITQKKTLQIKVEMQIIKIGDIGLFN